MSGQQAGRERTVLLNSDAAQTVANRPRVEGDREAGILQGVLEVLIELGYDRLTFDAVASHVRASKATLYRKWPTKAELVLAAIEHLKSMTHSDFKACDTGSLEGDVTFEFCHEPDYNEYSSQVFRAIAPALHRDPELTKFFNDRFIAPRRQTIRDAMERAQRRGEIGADADLDVLAAIVPAAITLEVLTSGEAPSPEFIQKVIREVLLPACRASVGVGTQHN